MVPVEDKRSPSKHVDSLKGPAEVDSGLIFNFVWVELMESQVQSSSGAGEKDGFCVCVCLLPYHHQDSPFMCVRVWLNTGKPASLFLGMGQAQWLWVYSATSSGKESSAL